MSREALTAMAAILPWASLAAVAQIRSQTPISPVEAQESDGPQILTSLEVIFLPGHTLTTTIRTMSSEDADGSQALGTSLASVDAPDQNSKPLTSSKHTATTRTQTQHSSLGLIYVPIPEPATTGDRVVTIIIRPTVTITVQPTELMSASLSMASQSKSIHTPRDGRAVTGCKPDNLAHSTDQTVETEPPNIPMDGKQKDENRGYQAPLGAGLGFAIAAGAMAINAMM